MFKITEIKPQKNNPNRLNIYLDGDFGFGIARVIAPWLKKGDTLSEKTIEELKTKDQVEQGYQRALNYLSYRDRSTEEIRRNLRKHDLEDPIIEEVLARLRQKHLVDDVDFAQKWIENRRTFHPRSRRALRSELRRKGVPDKIINPLLEEVDEREMAYRVAQKKKRRLRNLEWPEFRKKLNGYLGRRGFSYSVASEIVQQVWDERQDR
jgi:regulatory protein